MTNTLEPLHIDRDSIAASSFYRDNPFIPTLGDLTQSCLISQEVSRNKYFQEGETSLADMAYRVVRGLYFGDANRVHAQYAYEAIACGLWIPAGRILSGAGTSRNVTLQNCYVNARIDDSMESILEANSFNALTLRQGGGMGTDFSTIRPRGAVLKRLGPKAYASGPLPFMDGWNAWCSTIMSAGERRGAMMGTLCDTHPDLLSFIEAKQQQGRLTNFNVSILISDAFMEAIREDEEWVLYFREPPVKRDHALAEHDFTDDDNVQQFAYSVHQARDLWAKITKSTYEFSEPGVIFIDRINDLNNLHAIEDIRCTNPCVSGDTLILTDKGYRPIKWRAGLKTTVWNGHEWSEVIPFSTGVNPTYNVCLNNGAIIRATAGHEWPLRNGARVKTTSLYIDDELDVHEFPIVEGSTEFEIDAYSQGFYCGDGTKNAETSNLYKHNEGIKARLIGKYWNRNCVDQPGVRWVHGTMLPKDFVPQTGTVKYCVNWLAGLLDADGNIARPNKGAMPVLQITAKDRAFLEKIRLMLTRLGVNARFWERKDAGLKTGSNGKVYYADSTACLMISGKGAYQLVSLGMKTERVDLSWVRQPQGIARKGVRIKQITPAITEETFCLTEPKRNTFIANGVLTGNCGEQPLPPHGACNLASVNLALMVTEPYTARAEFNFDLLRKVTKIGHRFLDYVINASKYPLREQVQEQTNKRRTGLGFTGLADCYGMLGIRYGSLRAADLAERISQEIAFQSYETSIDLAEEFGFFPFWPKVKDSYLQENTFAGSRLPPHIRDRIRRHGIRNSLCNTQAPTGTTSVAFGNISSGIEPTFAHSMLRKVRQGDNTFKEYRELSFTARMFAQAKGIPLAEFRLDDLPSYMVTMKDISIEEHVHIQSRVQRWVDASVSKTINIPTERTYEEFVRVYELAYTSGCKGCTTYRPSDVRGSILSDGSTKPTQSTPLISGLGKRPTILAGKTYQVKWPPRKAALYVTINDGDDKKPREVFITSKDSSSAEWTTALSLMITANFRKGGDVSFVFDELKQIMSVHEGFWIEGKYYGSLPAYLGHVIEYHMNGGPPADEAKVTHSPTITPTPPDETQGNYWQSRGEPCPRCEAPALIRQEGCKTCTNCGYSDCN